LRAIGIVLRQRNYSLGTRATTDMLLMFSRKGLKGFSKYTKVLTVGETSLKARCWQSLFCLWHIYNTTTMFYIVFSLFYCLGGDELRPVGRRMLYPSYIWKQ
jgi:hypothetical protein